ncbi:MAG: tRNA dihydrouridine synthase [Lachnospiraceae bacterium]
MRDYFAPMEGITGYVYRNAFEACFGPMDKYFTPFLVPTQNLEFTFREREDVIPEHNASLYAVPQIMTNKAKDFIWTAKKLQDLGYQEVNLNLGCPSGTVVSKGRGSGFLAFPEELDAFLDEIFAGLDMKISIKTRLGKEQPEEFVRLIEIYNQYPLEELIIHPRVQTDFYKKPVHMDAFLAGLEQSKNPVCYNGSLFTGKELQDLKTCCPRLDRVMLGRGLLIDPWLIRRQKDGAERDKKLLKQFYEMLFHGYLEIMSGERNALYKMKELWTYQIYLFADSLKYGKRIKKSEKREEYEAAVSAVFRDLDFVTGDVVTPFV